MKATNNKQPNNKQSGAMLIEVLVSILIFSFGLLGLVGLQAVASQNSVSAQDRTIAANVANEMVSQMWLKNTSNPDNLTTEIAAWQTRASTKISGATGTVVENAGITTVAIQWHPTSRRDEENDSKYETQVVID